MKNNPRSTSFELGALQLRIDVPNKNKTSNPKVKSMSLFRRENKALLPINSSPQFINEDEEPVNSIIGCIKKLQNNFNIVYINRFVEKSP